MRNPCRCVCVCVCGWVLPIQNVCISLTLGEQIDGNLKWPLANTYKHTHFLVNISPRATYPPISPIRTICSQRAAPSKAIFRYNQSEHLHNMAIAQNQSNNIAEIIRINAIGYSADFAGNRFQASLTQIHSRIVDVSTQIARQRNTEVLWIAFEQRRLMNASKIATCHFQFLLLGPRFEGWSCRNGAKNASRRTFVLGASLK